jgi:hypothetical protein
MWGLLVAFHGNCCVGYLGRMPGLLRVDHELHPISFETTWYVPPQHRKLGFALQLLTAAATIGRPFVVAGMSQEAEQVYRKFGWQEFGPYSYLQLAITPSQWASLPARAVQKGLALLGYQLQQSASWADSCHRWAYPLVRWRAHQQLQAATQQALKDVTWEQSAQLVDVDYRLSPEDRPPVEFQRSMEVVNWMIANPWIGNGDRQLECEKEYAFATPGNSFRLIPLRLFTARDRSYLGFLVLSVKKRQGIVTLKLLDHRLSGSEAEKLAAAVLIRYVTEQRVDHFELPAEWGNLLATMTARQLKQNKRERRYFVCRPKDYRGFLDVLQRCHLNYWDGDRALT